MDESLQLGDNPIYRGGPNGSGPYGPGSQMGSQMPLEGDEDDDYDNMPPPSYNSGMRQNTMQQSRDVGSMQQSRDVGSMPRESRDLGNPVGRTSG